MATNMRGLNIFLSDLRACKTKDEEEKRVFKEMAHIRAKFKAGKLSTYDKKKYICKLLYMYLLGYEVEFALMECVNLISSQKFSEKKIGYLAIMLLITENHELIRLVINSIRKDLNDSNEAVTCLALHAVANICTKDMAEALCGTVYKLFASRSSSPFVRKKAALSLLRFYRKFPHSVSFSDWTGAIVDQMHDSDNGVLLCTTSLIVGIVQAGGPAGLEGSLTNAVDKLYELNVQKRFSPDCLYYKVPAPWTQLKLLQLVQLFSPVTDAAAKPRLQAVLQTILENSQGQIKNQQHSNIQNAIFVAAVKLGFANDAPSQWQRDCVAQLSKFVESNETNLRCLGLETLGNISTSAEALRAIGAHGDVILKRLTDKDISVRRRALDLLYQSCDSGTAEDVVAQFLTYLKTAELAIREEMVLKIAVLAEKYATDYRWYLDTMLQLMQTAGEHVSEEVWFRVAQLIVNKPELQKYASERLLSYLDMHNCHETIVKLTAFTLGEFGHLIAGSPSAMPYEQLQALQSKIPTAAAPTKSIILSALLKLANVFPEIKPTIIHIFEEQSHSLDAELQQRACEYLALLKSNNEALLESVCETLPNFPISSTNPILARLGRKSSK